MSAQDVANVAAQAGFSGQSLIYAIAVSLAEDPASDPNAHYTSLITGEDSRGYWQINVQSTANPQYASVNLYDGLTNAQAAYAISSNGTNFSPWSTWTNGAYQAYLSQAQQLAASVNSSSSGSASSSQSPVSSVPTSSLSSIAKFAGVLVLAALAVDALGDL